VLIQIEYRVTAENRDAFLKAITALAPERQRDGGYGWRVFEDVEDPQVFTEVFYAPSWLEHLRHHGRVTKADAELQARVSALHQGPAPPRVRHFAAASQVDIAAPLPLPADHHHH
jgi:quinol monooxygenase YgiN